MPGTADRGKVRPLGMQNAKVMNDELERRPETNQGGRRCAWEA
jgi:hypothetical protein